MKKILLLFCFSGWLVSCNSPSRETLLQNITEAEAAFNNNQTQATEQIIQNAIAAYENFAQSFPKDSMAPEFLFNAAKYHRTLMNHEQAIAIHEKIISKYPEHNKTPYSQFMIGFINENELNNLEKAKEAYEKFLEKYPDHELSGDVRFSLQNLGKPLEQIIKEFEMQQQEADVES